MDASDYSQYLTAMRVLKAREHYMQLRIACYTDMKKENQQKFFRELTRTAFPSTQKPRALTGEEVARFINR